MNNNNKDFFSFTKEQNKKFTNWFKKLTVKKVTIEQLVVATMYCCGLRAEEIINLNASDLQFNEITEDGLYPFLTIPNVREKQGYVRNIPMPYILAYTLNLYLTKKIEDNNLAKEITLNNIPLFSSIKKPLIRLKIEEINKACAQVLEDFGSFEDLLECTKKHFEFFNDCSVEDKLTKEIIHENSLYAYFFRINYCNSLSALKGLSELNIEYLMGVLNLQYKTKKGKSELETCIKYQNIIKIHNKVKNLPSFCMDIL